MKKTNNQPGSLLIIMCVIISIIMVSSVGVFSLLLLARETVQFRTTFAKQLTITHSLLNYGINTLLANKNAFTGDVPQNITIKVPSIPGMPAKTYGTVTIAGSSPTWQLQSQLHQGETILCKVSCSFTHDADDRQRIKAWKIG